MNVTGWRCTVCGATVTIDSFAPWRCPNSTASDRHHLLQMERALAPLRPSDDPNPFVAFDDEFAWSAFADAHGMEAGARADLVRRLDVSIADVDGVGFHRTPLKRRHRLSLALGFEDNGGVWVKDETGSVGGSHKARHLMGILLHLIAAEDVGIAPWSAPADRPSLAIASCGNAAIAAATLARAASWPIVVFVPPWAASPVTQRLVALGATVRVCPRLDEDPPGDPCVLRCREAVGNGAIPFSVQGPENALCIDGGRTLGWEITEELGHLVDRVVVQVGGGAMLSSLGAAFRSAGVMPIVHGAQTAGCAPLARAWQIAADLPGGRSSAAQHWSACMWPWEEEPASIADGILDDETYDWLGAFDAMRSGGPVVVPEIVVARAHGMARDTTGIDVSATGSAGLAGLLHVREQIASDERVVVIFSGVQR